MLQNSLGANMVDYKQYLYYDETSPSGLRWSVTRNGNAKKDSVAGGLTADGRYWKIQLNKKTYYLHRVVWEMHNGRIPDDLVVNHKDNNPHNNKISNLEVCSVPQNMQRQFVHTTDKVQKANTSGLTGIRTFVDGRGTTRTEANWYEDGKQKRKSFNHNTHSPEEALALAIEYRQEKVKEFYK
jgi:hypothetical protein